MKTATRTRTVRLTDGATRALVIHQQDGAGPMQVDAYFLADLPVPGGRGFALRKHDGTLYEVRLGPRADHCTCPGHTYHARKGVVCKHISALRALLTRGRLVVPVCEEVAS